MDKLYDWLFHFNPYKGFWYAFKREDKEKYFNGELKNVLHNVKITELINFIKND